MQASSSRILPIVLSLLVSAPAAAADEGLTLNQAIQRAVSGNVDLKRERVVIEIADAQLMAAQGQFDFVATADLTFQRRTTPPLSAEDIAGGFNNTLGVDLGVSRLLETGGSLRFGVQTNATNTNSRFSCGTVGGPQRDCTYYSSNLGLTFTHPLLRGLGAEFTQANIRRQRIERDIALLNRQMRAANVVRDVITSYWELAYATQDLAIRRSAVELAREQLRITRAQIDVGRLAVVDAAAVERAIGERMQEVVISEQALYFRTLELRQLLGLAPDPALPPFAASDAPQAAPRQIDVSGEIARALDSNPQLRALRMGLRLSELDIQTASNTLRPRVDFVGNIGSTGRKPGLLDTLAQTTGLDDMTWSAGLSVELPIQNRTARGQMRAAQLSGEVARLDAGQMELTIRDTVMRVASNVGTASRRVELAKATVGFALQNLEAERARFSVGRATNNDVLLRQQELKNAEIQVVRATVDLLNSEAALSAITAEVLDRYGLGLKGA